METITIGQAAEAVVLKELVEFVALVVKAAVVQVVHMSPLERFQAEALVLVE